MIRPLSPTSANRITSLAHPPRSLRMPPASQRGRPFCEGLYGMSRGPHDAVFVHPGHCKQGQGYAFPVCASAFAFPFRYNDTLQIERRFLIFIFALAFELPFSLSLLMRFPVFAFHVVFAFSVFALLYNKTDLHILLFAYCYYIFTLYFILFYFMLFYYLFIYRFYIPFIYSIYIIELCYYNLNIIIMRFVIYILLYISILRLWFIYLYIIMVYYNAI